MISTITHTIVKSIPVRDPRGIDITQDNSLVWVGTTGNQLYEINTSTFTSIRHPVTGLGLPGFKASENLQVFALSDGTVMLLANILGIGFDQLAIWDPVSNVISPLTFPAANGAGIVQRTGDGKKVYCFPSDSGGIAFFYDVIAKSFSTPVNIGGQPVTAAVNFDGSRVVAGFAMFDGNFNFIGAIPGFGALMGGPAFDGGTAFSQDTGFLYEVSMPGFTPEILTIDPNTLGLVNAAPAMPMIPAGAQLSPPFFMPIPFDVDSTGMVLGFQYYGIAFDDATYAVHFNPTQPGTPTFLQHMTPQTGPLSGGTTSGGFGNAFSITPDVWYGPNRGVGRINGGNTLTITSPAGTVPGPVNVKMLFPDGIEVFNPLFFSYGPFAQFSVQSGASPTGGSTGQIAGYGLPTSASTGHPYRGSISGHDYVVFAPHWGGQFWRVPVSSRHSELCRASWLSRLCRCYGEHRGGQFYFAEGDLLCPECDGLCVSRCLQCNSV